jgi:CheY-like chemotaxis protein
MTGKTVLLVDDSRVARMMARKLIEHHRAGWAIIEATTGDEAVQRFAETHPDFVVMDVNMPGISGIEASRRIRQAYPDAVITLLTANIQDPIRHQAEELGVGFLSKPIREDALMAFLSDDVP